MYTKNNNSSQYFKQLNVEIQLQTIYIYNMPRPLYVIQKEKLRSKIFVCVGGGRGGGEAKQIYLQPCYLLLYFLQMHLYC